MGVAIGASFVLGCAGYLYLVQRADEAALRRAAMVWALVAGGLAAVISAVLWQPGEWMSVALIGLCPLFVALGLVDVSEHRLPNRMTGLVAVFVTAGAVIATAASADKLHLERALLGGVLLGVGYLFLALLGGGAGMGLGDVKLAPSLGALTAWSGWNTWAAGAALTFVLGGIWGGVLLLRGAGLKARMPFGPFMLVGAVIALISA